MKQIGFYFNCYKNKFATEKVLSYVRLYYPENPIFLMSDNGDDFQDIAKKYNCYYYYSPINVLGGKIINGKKTQCFSNQMCAKEFLKIIQLCLKTINVEYIVLLEDDVLINGVIEKLPKYSGGAVNSNSFTICLKHTQDLSKIKNHFPLMEYTYWNQAGGSIIHSKTLEDCINSTNFDEICMFDDYCKEGLEFWHTNDILIGFILSINGKSSEGWTNTTHSNIIHPYKNFYSKNLGIEHGVYRK